MIAVAAKTRKSRAKRRRWRSSHLVIWWNSSRITVLASSPSVRTATVAADEPRGLAGRSVSTRADLGRRRNELLVVLGGRRARRAVPVRRARARGTRRRHAPNRVQLALLPAGCRARPALRLSRPRG